MLRVLLVGDDPLARGGLAYLLSGEPGLVVVAQADGSLPSLLLPAGEYDLVAMVRVRRHEELADLIPGRINRIEGIRHTETHIAFQTYSRHDLEAAFSLGMPDGD